MPKLSRYIGNTDIIGIVSYWRFNLKFSTYRMVSVIVELADPENHTTEPKITTLSYIQSKLWQIFW